jgi:hypothetical protein
MNIATFPEYHIALNKFSAANRSKDYDDAEMHRRLRRYWHICAVLHRRMGNTEPGNDPAVLHFMHQQS